MAVGSLLALLDDIATILDDVSVMTKVAAKKTAGVLGDDLALNAQQVSGVSSERELPVVWAVAKGSFVNKLILVPAALAISYFIPWLITPMLMLGGAFLCFEGFEKLAHRFMRHGKETTQKNHAALKKAISTNPSGLMQLETTKIKGAIRTDFILSAEIIVIALGTVTTASFIQQVIVVATIAIVMTAGVYGLVAGIVRLDDFGFYLMKQRGSGKQWLNPLGERIIAFAPVLMRTLTVLGTAAMFLVGGGIIVHGLPFLHHAITHIAQLAATIPSLGQILASLIPLLLNAVVGIVLGAALLGGISLAQKAGLIPR